MSENESYLQAVTEVARIAGGVAMKYFRQDPEERLKSDGSPVSDADLDAERTARDWIEKRFPGDGILGEEFEETRGGAANRWIIDPIDGTFSFLLGVPLWGTLVAVTRGEEVLAGAAYFPALDEIISAAPGCGAWYNDSRCRVSAVAELKDARVLTTDARFLRDESRRERWLNLQNSVRAMRTWGDCYGYLLVATGRADVMVDDETKPWDAAPLLPVITEAGGVFTDWKGTATAFGGDAVATNAALSAQVRHILAGKS